jgi:hypothetical protein
MKTLFKYLSAAFLFCAALNANAQTGGFTIYYSTLSFPRDIVAACPLLQRGDTASTVIWAGASKTKANLGTVTLTTTTTSGVSVTVEGTLVGSTSSGTLYVTALTIGDPLGANCSFVNLNFSVGLKVYKHYGFF